MVFIVDYAHLALACLFWAVLCSTTKTHLELGKCIEVKFFYFYTNTIDDMINQSPTLISKPYPPAIVSLCSFRGYRS